MNNVVMKSEQTAMQSMPVAAAPRAQSAAAGVEMSRAMAEVQAAIYLAKQFPRDRMELVERIRVQCGVERLAKSATYTYAKGNQSISGPSIRLAEAIAQQYGNFQFGWNEISRNAGVSEIICYAWDTETNVKRETKFHVKHWRDTKSGGYAIKDEREIYELCANQAARRMRACILNLIPGDIVDEALEQCAATLESKFKITPDFIKNVIAEFAKHKVTQAQLEAYIQRKMDALTPGLASRLHGIMNSLRDGMGTAADYFEPEAAPVATAAAETGKGAAGAKDAIKSQQAANVKPEAKPAAAEGGDETSSLFDGDNAR